jgi:hypothetical protein
MQGNNKYFSKSRILTILFLVIFLMFFTMQMAWCWGWKDFGDVVVLIVVGCICISPSLLSLFHDCEYMPYMGVILTEFVFYILNSDYCSVVISGGASLIQLPTILLGFLFNFVGFLISLFIFWLWLKISSLFVGRSQN